MIKKNKPSASYLNHPLNNSPSKAVPKFGHQPRFVQQKAFSPDKFYDIPDTKEKRTTSFGFGNKIDFTQENIGQPAKYHLRTQFDQICQGYRFGVRPSTKDLVRDKSTGHFKRTISPVYDLPLNSPSPKKNVSPQPSGKKHKEEERPVLQSKQALQNSEQNRQKKSASRLKYQFSKSYLLDNKKTSYIEFIRQKKQSPPKHTMSTFGVDPRWKRETSFQKPGPGSYNRFSQFGENQNAY